MCVYINLPSCRHIGRCEQTNKKTQTKKKSFFFFNHVTNEHTHTHLAAPNNNFVFNVSSHWMKKIIFVRLIFCVFFWILLFFVFLLKKMKNFFVASNTAQKIEDCPSSCACWKNVLNNKNLISKRTFFLWLIRKNSPVRNPLIFDWKSQPHNKSTVQIIKLCVNQ